MKLYVAGPMTGIEDWNLPAFRHAAAELRRRGYVVENPAEVDLDPAVASWTDFMRADVIKLAGCDGLAFLDGWQASRGASLEVFLATQLGIRVMPFGDWLMASTGAVFEAAS